MFRLDLLLLSCLFVQHLAVAQDSRLLATISSEPIEEIVHDAITKGDPKLGALVFFQPSLQCANCHATSDSGPLSLPKVGPNLTRFDKTTSDVAIAESVLHPSKVISKGFETTRVLTASGQIMTGLLVSKPDEPVQLRDPSTGKVIDIAEDEIESIDQTPLSIMPAGLVGQLANRQQLIDLIRYLIELRDGGDVRSLELQPVVMPTNEPLPEYEAHLDHAGMIRELDQKAYERGEAIYIRLCVNCHGTVNQAGSLPTSLRFANGKFKHGYDPFAMYQTLTSGFGLMTPQRWMVPQQKYDVIHYVREKYLKSHNPTQYQTVDDAYLGKLPTGDTHGPEPSFVEPWQQMDYGPNLMATIEVGDDGTNFAYKGHAIRLDHGPGGIAQGKERILYDLDTMRIAAVWEGEGFIDWNGINFNARHSVHTRIVGKVLFQNNSGPGWANPATGAFEELRQPGRDGRFYGPLPKIWLNYLGSYVNGPDTILHYQVGDAEVHELPGMTRLPDRVIIERQLMIGPAKSSLKLQVADRHECLNQEQETSLIFSLPTEANSILQPVAFGFSGDVTGIAWTSIQGRLLLEVPASDSQRLLTIYAYPATGIDDAKSVLVNLKAGPPHLDFHDRLQGGVKRWPDVVTTTVTTQDTGGPFAVDTITYPVNNPWFCRLRLTGFDFFPDGDSAAVCDWDGNVWKVSGLAQLNANEISTGIKVQWRRIASGLYQPLGLKIRNGEIFVGCRDQICKLIDLNGDGETDYYESFNHDHQVTEHFHEFAMGLQTDADGNFYYAKSACHALPAVVPQHGTLLKVSADGAKTEILATGFRAANGVCLNPDGSFFVTDQEGHWNPKNRINWVKRGGFYGNMLGYHDRTDTSDSAMESPLCWITNAFDRSPAELLWVTSDKWGPLQGSLLNLSYGYGKVYIVPHEQKGDVMQGGMCELPIPQFPTGIMRGRFHPLDGQLYLAGMYAWAGTQEQNGGFFRVRYTGKPVYVPERLEVKGKTIRIAFTDDIDPTSITAERFKITTWSIVRTENYGSEHVDTKALKVASASWTTADRSVVLEIPDLIPTWCMEIKYDLLSSTGQPVAGVIHNTIHSLE